MNSRGIALLGGFIAFALIAQEPGGWKQPLLQPMIPPKAVGGGRAPEWRMPLVYPTLPPTIAGGPLVTQHHTLFVPQQGTNGLRMTVTNSVVIVPGVTNRFDFGKTNVFVIPFDEGFAGGGALPSCEQYLHDWKPELMYPTYPPKLAPLSSLGLLERR